MALRIISTIVLVFEFIMRIGLFIMIVKEINKNEEEKINMIEALRFLISIISIIFLTVAIWLI